MMKLSINSFIDLRILMADSLISAQMMRSKLLLIIAALCLVILSSLDRQAFAGSSGSPMSSLGSATGATSEWYPGYAREQVAKDAPIVKKEMNADQSSGKGGGPQSTQTKTYSLYRDWPQKGTYEVTMSGTPETLAAVDTMYKSINFGAGAGFPASGADLNAIGANTAQGVAQMMRDPQTWKDAAPVAGATMANSAANSMAGAAVSQAMGAIQFTQHYLVNFTAQAGSSWQSLRNNIFIPMALLLLLPGAVLAQVRAIVAQSSTILGEVNPFEGIIRSIIAIFMIPASFLVVNYGIDLANSITYSINTEYTNLFGTDMYQDAQCAEMRAFPVNNPGQNTNAFIPSIMSAATSALAGLSGNSPWTNFEATGLAQKLFDPCVGLNQSLIPDESTSSTMTTNRLMMNGSNSFLAMTWNIMCAFQTVFLYYLWCMGPVVAALWVWPMERLRSALPSWIEGVITLCFWSLFWNVVVLLLACFRGVGETGTVIVTALNSLATISVWYAFDFSALISEGAGYAMMNAVSQAIGQAAKGGAGGGGGGGGGGGQKSAGGGGGGMQGAGGMPPGFMGPGFIGGGAVPGTVGAGMPGNGMGGLAMGGVGAGFSGTSGSMGGLSGGAGQGGAALAGGSLSPSGLVPPGGSLPNLSLAAKGAGAGGGAADAINGGAAGGLTAQQMDQNFNQSKQLSELNQAMQADKIAQQNALQASQTQAGMQAFQDQARRQQQDAATQAGLVAQNEMRQKQQEQVANQAQMQQVIAQDQQQRIAQEQRSGQEQRAAQTMAMLNQQQQAERNAAQARMNPAERAQLAGLAGQPGTPGSGIPGVPGSAPGLVSVNAGGPPLSPGSVPAEFSRSSAPGSPADLSNPILASQGGVAGTGAVSNLPPVDLPPVITTVPATGFTDLPAIVASTSGTSVPDIVTTSSSYISADSVPDVVTTSSSYISADSTPEITTSYVADAGTQYSDVYTSPDYARSSSDYDTSSAVSYTDPGYSSADYGSAGYSTTDYSSASYNTADYTTYPSQNIAYNSSSSTDYTYARESSAPQPQPSDQQVYRSEQSVSWTPGDSTIARESVTGQASQSAAYNQPQQQIQQPQQQQQYVQQEVPQPQQQIMYVPAEVKQQRQEIQQVQAKQVQENIVQQPPKATPPQTKPSTQKPINTVYPVQGSPPAVPKKGISSIVGNMQRGAKPGQGQPQGSSQSNTANRSGTFARQSQGNKPEETITKSGSLGEHLARLQRGGGREAAKAKDILGEAGLPPLTESEEEEKKNKGEQDKS